MTHTFRKYIIASLFALPLFVQSQESLTGIVLEVIDGQEVPLQGASVYWQATSIGSNTDAEGKFSVPYTK